MKLTKWIHKRKRILLVGMIIVLLLVTLLPSNKIPLMPNWKSLLQPDKIVHVLLFSGVSCILLLNISRYRYWKNVFIGFLIGLFLAVVTEILQGVLPIGRSMNIYDAIANIIGLFVGFLLWTILIKRNK